MRRTREQAAATRSRIIETASRLFRERGINGIGLSDLMVDAGLTHGGFYKHFASKEALVAEACESAFARAKDEADRRAAKVSDEDALAAMVGDYLSPLHRDHCGQGCAIAALGSEAARGDGVVKAALDRGIEMFRERIAQQARRSGVANVDEFADAAASAMVGGLMLARLARDPNDSEAILRNTKEFILQAAKR